MAEPIERIFFERVRDESARLSALSDVPPPLSPEEIANANRLRKKQKIIDLLKLSGIVAKLAAEKSLPTDIDFFTKIPPPPLKLKDLLRGVNRPDIIKRRFSGWILPVNFRQPTPSVGDFDIPSWPHNDYRRGVAIIAGGGDYQVAGRYEDRHVADGGVHLFAMGEERAGVVRAQLDNVCFNVSPDYYDVHGQNTAIFESHMSELFFGQSSGVDAINSALVNFAAVEGLKTGE